MTGLSPQRDCSSIGVNPKPKLKPKPKQSENKPSPAWPGQAPRFRFPGAKDGRRQTGSDFYPCCTWDTKINYNAKRSEQIEIKGWQPASCLSSRLSTAKTFLLFFGSANDDRRTHRAMFGRNTCIRTLVCDTSIARATGFCMASCKRHSPSVYV